MLVVMHEMGVCLEIATRVIFIEWGQSMFGDIKGTAARCSSFSPIRKWP